MHPQPGGNEVTTVLTLHALQQQKFGCARSSIHLLNSHSEFLPSNIYTLVRERKPIHQLLWCRAVCDRVRVETRQVVRLQRNSQLHIWEGGDQNKQASVPLWTYLTHRHLNLVTIKELAIKTNAQTSKDWGRKKDWERERIFKCFSTYVSVSFRIWGEKVTPVISPSSVSSIGPQTPR